MRIEIFSQILGSAPVFVVTLGDTDDDYPNAATIELQTPDEVVNLLEHYLRTVSELEWQKQQLARELYDAQEKLEKLEVGDELDRLFQSKKDKTA